jgi:hypothetical protein
MPSRPTKRQSMHHFWQASWLCAWQSQTRIVLGCRLYSVKSVAQASPFKCPNWLWDYNPPNFLFMGTFMQSMNRIWQAQEVQEWIPHTCATASFQTSWGKRGNDTGWWLMLHEGLAIWCNSAARDVQKAVLAPSPDIKWAAQRRLLGHPQILVGLTYIWRFLEKM